MFNMFSTTWSLCTPPELRPYGWLTQDFFIPPLATLLYLFLTSPISQPLIPAAPSLHLNSTTPLTPFTYFLAPILPEKPVYLVTEPWEREDARALLGVGITGLFVMRAVWGYYGKEILGMVSQKRGRKPGESRVPSLEGEEKRWTARLTRVLDFFGTRTVVSEKKKTQ